MRLSNHEFDSIGRTDLGSMACRRSSARRMENVIVEVQSRQPGRELLQGSLRHEAGTRLLGYCDGVPLTEKSVESVAELPERILIFKEPDRVRTRRREPRTRGAGPADGPPRIGHHFGMDEDELDELIRSEPGQIVGAGLHGASGCPAD
jgi:predicted Zn-dependent protease with MMP-like domain